MSDVVFLTGGTGFIGTQIAKRLLAQTDLRLLVLVRSKNNEQSVVRLKRVWWEFPELLQQVGNRIEAVNGDVSETRFGLANSDYQKLVQTVTYIIHAAADTTPNVALEKLRNTNVKGTANVIELAKQVNEDHGLRRFSFVSTAYVAGKRSGVIHEHELSDHAGFCSNYERTKYESEALVNAVKEEFPTTVFRPSLVIGDSETGYAKTFNTIYYLLKLYLTDRLRVVPVDSTFRVNIVPVDYVADAITKLTFDPKAAGVTFHLTVPKEKSPTASELIGFVKKWAHETINLDLPKVMFVSSAGNAIKSYSRLKSLIGSSNKKTDNAFNILAPYFSQKQEFNRKNVDTLMGKYNFDWHKYLPRILQYAVYYSFFHRSERTVHEQILFRLNSDSKPFRFHEITKNGVTDYDHKTVRNEILRVASAMNAVGIKKGDIVAVVGLNNLRYLVIDVAAGLLGAVTSPIYYTSPFSEINKILTETEAKLFFVGAPKILHEIESLTVNVPVVSFCTEVSTSQIPEPAVSWSRFLEKATDPTTVSSFAPVDFSDTATIRYTYGSTGKSKGACLEHGNIRYVAEALASNFPWKVRTTKASYLSFLPLNHVAEGITAIYSPYFIPAAMDIYFLEDFHDLKNALQKAKPTVFFSIPRFYEKVWEEILANPFGQQYFKAENSVKKRWLKKLVKFSVLRKSGLNKCAQFIVGAACTSKELLQNFQDLGIEVHNAYGLSEAPLVTMNRLGSNNVETVGPPLRDTKICIDQDGEILVKGPQVMRGYLNQENDCPFRDGWFATGDIGEVSAQGHLKIFGRKKNILITSYGKKVPTDLIEAALKSIESVEEAVLIGNNRPYCSAVLWVDKQKFDNQTIEHAISQINSRLEEPLQIKRWETLDKKLLNTTNVSSQLKPKRQELLQQTDGVIEKLYDVSASNVSWSSCDDPKHQKT